MAGDWVGQEGMLVDAALASAEVAAQSALSYAQANAIQTGTSAQVQCFAVCITPGHVMCMTRCNDGSQMFTVR